jgi:hypothetical protein
MNDLIWYAIGRKKERRIHERTLAVERYTVEQGLRAQYGLPALPPQLALTRPSTRRAVRITGRMIRRVLIAVVLMTVLLVAIFAVYAIGYGVQHHLIYPVRSR